jgi:hypothetical protein
VSVVYSCGLPESDFPGVGYVSQLPSSSFQVHLDRSWPLILSLLSSRYPEEHV